MELLPLFLSLSLTHTLRLSFRFHVFLWLLANLLPPAAVSISPAEGAPPAPESCASFSASSSGAAPHNGGQHELALTLLIYS